MNEVQELKPSTEALVGKMASALYTTFQLPEGSALCAALGAPESANNREALQRWVAARLGDLDPVVWISVMNHLVDELDALLQREERLSCL